MSYASISINFIAIISFFEIINFDLVLFTFGQNYTIGRTLWCDVLFVDFL